MKKKDMVGIGTIAVFACLLLCTPALADYSFDGFPVETRVSGTVNGGVFIDSVPWDGQTTLTGNFNVPNGNVIWARLYTGIWGGNPEFEGWVNVTFNGFDDTNGLGPIHLQGANDANPNVWCSGFGKHWMYYIVTDLVNAGAENTATTTKINATVGSFDGRVYGIVLVVVYEGGDNPKNIQYWINDGSDGLNNYGDGSNGLNYDDTAHKKKIRSPNSARAHNDGTTDFAGSVAGSVTDAELTMVHLTAYDPLCANCLAFNGAALDTSMVDSNNFELNRWDVASHVEPSVNYAWYSRGEDPSVSVCNAILTLESEEKPDLNVTAINVNADLPGLCGLPFGPVPHAGARTQCNSISAEIEEKNGVATGAFDVCFYVDDDLKCTVPVAGMAGGDKKTVWCNCSWYPLAGPHTIKVTVDCEDVIDESDETNNRRLKDVTAVQHGLKGNSWQDGRSIATLQCHPQDNINLTYSVGDSKKAGVGWTEYYSNWTQSELSIPDGATIEKARLYAYYNWDKTPDGDVTDSFSLSFNGVPILPDEIYTDTKHPSRLCNGCDIGMCKYNYPYGMLAYDVIGQFNAIADNTAVLTNSYPGGMTAMTGMLLVVVYNHPDEPGRIIWINEGFDTLFAGVYWGTDYGVSSDEATTYAPFEDCVPIPMDEVRKATLVTITNHAGDTPGSDKNRLYFNDVLLGDGLWSPYMGGTEIGANAADVLDHLDSTENTAAYQSNIPAGGTSGDWMEASNAFLILEKKPKPDLNVTAINVNADLPGLCGLPFGPVPHAGARTQCNSISAEIEEKNGVATGAFDVCFYVDDDLKCTVPVAGMAGGDKKTVWCNCSWYPLAGPHTIKVTVDCEDVIDESDETNNRRLKDVTAVQHGLKGNSWQDGRSIATLQCHPQDNINLTYSVGDSKKAGVGWAEYYSNWTQSELSIPDGATIEKARLYAYYNWDKTPDGDVTDSFSLSFNGVLILPDEIYTDTKHPSRLCNGCDIGMCKYNYPYGMLAYDVTDEFNAIADNTAVLTNSYPGGMTAMTGMLLVVVYNHPDEPGRIIWINEGFDTLFAGVYWGTDYGVSSDEATTYAPFEDCVPIPMDEVKKATLVTITNHAGDTPGSDKNRLYFNDVLLGDGLWSPYMGGTEIGANAADVLDHLDSTENTAAYQSNIPAGGTSGDWMEASNAFLILEKKPKPDLSVTEITPNCGYLFASESNEICAKIENIGGGDAGAFNVGFVTDRFSAEIRIAGLAAGENATVCINDTTIRTAGDLVTIIVIADCNYEVDESDETNNVLALATTVVNNGYKGKRYTGGDDINTWKTFELNGNLIYSLGDSYYLSSYTYPEWTEYNAHWDASELPIPGTATIETARLFVPYTWDKAGVMPAYAAMSFNGNLRTHDAHYSDEKGWGTSYPYGMLVYEVTADFDTTGNVANLINSYPGGGGVSMRGMLLVVVYADSSEPERTILMNEEFDMLYGGASKCTTPEEATAYAPFGTIDTTYVQQATLITVAPGAGPNEGDLGFNTQMWYDVWNFVGTGTPTPQIGIAETDVTSYLQAADNEAYFRSSADYMEASNAFLILEKEVPCPAEYAVYQAKVIDPEKHLNKLRALRDNKLEDGYVDRYYDYSPELTLVLSRADSDLVKDGAQLLSRYSIPVGMHVQGMDVNERISKQDVEEALSFTDRLKREVMKNRDAIGVESTEAIIDFIDEFEGQVKASEGKTFSEALKSSIYYED